MRTAARRWDARDLSVARGGMRVRDHADGGCRHGVVGKFVADPERLPSDRLCDPLISFFARSTAIGRRRPGFDGILDNRAADRRKPEVRGFGR